MTTTHTGVETEAATDTDAENAFLDQWTDAGMLSDTDEGAKKLADEGAKTVPDSEDDNENEGSDDDLDLGDEDDDSNEDEEADDQETVEASDDAVVKIIVDGAEKSVAVKDLKRLYGQEASLTRKSQEIADARKLAEDSGARFVAASEKMLTKAQARFAPYAEIDWMIAQKTLNTAEFTALRKEALEAHEDVQFLESEVEGVMSEVTEARKAEMVEAAKESLAVLKEKVPNWDQNHYNEIRQHAVTAGLNIETVNSIVDPSAILLLRDAMLYRQAKERAEAKRKAAPAPRRVMKSSKGAGLTPNSQKALAGKAIERLKVSGSDEDATNAFMSRWSDDA